MGSASGQSAMRTFKRLGRCSHPNIRPKVYLSPHDARSLFITLIIPGSKMYLHARTASQRTRIKDVSDLAFSPQIRVSPTEHTKNSIPPAFNIPLKINNTVTNTILNLFCIDHARDIPVKKSFVTVHSGRCLVSHQPATYQTKLPQHIIQPQTTPPKPIRRHSYACNINARFIHTAFPKTKLIYT